MVSQRYGLPVPITVWKARLTDLAAERVQIKTFLKGGETREERTVLGGATKTVDYEIGDRFHATVWFSTELAVLAAEGRLLAGEYPAEVLKRYSSWKLAITTNEVVAAKRQQAETALQLRLDENEPIKAQAIQIPDYTEGGGPIYGCPEEDGVWRLFMRHYPDPKTDPTAWILVPMKGFRSKSTGSSFAELVADFFRGDGDRIRQTLDEYRNRPNEWCVGGGAEDVYEPSTDPEAGSNSLIGELAEQVEDLAAVWGAKLRR